MHQRVEVGRREAVVRWLLERLDPGALERVCRAAGGGPGASVRDLVAGRAVDLDLLVRTLGPDEWRAALRSRAR
ncbi:MAG: hypothetical protein KIT58_12085 [Planctomycetota bacterium]|nr:hypothetical protein [Planctomycetota bacterium]